MQGFRTAFYDELTKVSMDLGVDNLITPTEAFSDSAAQLFSAGPHPAEVSPEQLAQEHQAVKAPVKRKHPLPTTTQKLLKKQAFFDQLANPELLSQLTNWHSTVPTAMGMMGNIISPEIGSALSHFGHAAALDPQHMLDFKEGITKLHEGLPHASPRLHARLHNTRVGAEGAWSQARNRISGMVGGPTVPKGFIQSQTAQEMLPVPPKPAPAMPAVPTAKPAPIPASTAPMTMKSVRPTTTQSLIHGMPPKSVAPLNLKPPTSLPVKPVTALAGTATNVAAMASKLGRVGSFFKSVGQSALRPAMALIR